MLFPHFKGFFYKIANKNKMKKKFQFFNPSHWFPQKISFESLRFEFTEVFTEIVILQRSSSCRDSIEYSSRISKNTYTCINITIVRLRSQAIPGSDKHQQWVDCFENTTFHSTDAIGTHGDKMFRSLGFRRTTWNLY